MKTTKEEYEASLKAKGFIQDAAGEWFKPPKRWVPAGSVASGAEPEQAVRDDALAAAPREAGHAGRFLVRIVSHRHRLLDPDNLCGKYFLDCARRAALIRDDRPEDISFQIDQVKIPKSEKQHTEITITPIQ